MQVVALRRIGFRLPRRLRHRKRNYEGAILDRVCLERSVVVICAGDNGYEYLGVRLSDDAVMRTAAETTSSRGFLARTAGVTYAVSPTELLVTAGTTVIKQERMIEYRGSD